MNPIHLLLGEVHLLMREGLVALLRKKSGTTVPAQAVNIPEALQILANQPIDIVITDIGLDQCNGIDLIREARTINPASRFIVLTAYRSPLAVAEAFKAGTAAYLLKDDAFTQLSDVILRVASGETGIVSSRLQKEEIDKGVALSARERAVLQFVATGLSNKEIGNIMHLSIKTVETYRLRLMEKLGVHKCTELVREAFLAGFAGKVSG